jgi:NAD+ synthase (glutamine-hydrolysing)
MNETLMTIQTLLAQINPCVGDVQNNKKAILDIIAKHPNHDIIIFPELALCGYPPEDLLLYPSFIEEIEAATQEISEYPTQSLIILGTAHQGYNAAAIISKQKIQYYYKHILPNYGVFDEKRYFQSGPKDIFQFELKNHRFGLMICEDIWDEDITKRLPQGLDTLLSIHASPYHQKKMHERLQTIKNISKENINLIYVNQVGGQDGLLFDGQSMVVSPNHHITAKAKAFEADLLSVELKNNQWIGRIEKALPPLAEIYQGLCLGLKDFMHKNGIQKAVLGLSGGIDSALTLAIAVDAIGAEHVHAILMPSQFSADISVIDAEKQAKTLGVSYEIIPIEPLVQNFKNHLTNASSLTLQNLQARIRGILLMAYSNQHQALLINTSNKSESAVGYGTLYGDMCGGFAPLQDVYKTMVYELARFRNHEKEIIPSRVITRAPSAELAPNQTDQDDLPPYELLDELLIQIIEKRASEQELIQKYPKDLVQKIFKKIKISEFKRFQAAPGIKMTPVAFGKDWRMPISNHWKL